MVKVAIIIIIIKKNQKPVHSTGRLTKPIHN